MPSSHCASSRSFHLSLRSSSCLSYYNGSQTSLNIVKGVALTSHAVSVSVNNVDELRKQPQMRFLQHRWFEDGDREQEEIAAYFEKAQAVQ